jgi:hypothetical protein
VSFREQTQEPPSVIYTITATAGADGIILPAGEVQAAQDGTQPFAFIPNTGYEIAAVQIDGTPNAAALAGSYTFANVTANHTIAVSFREKTTGGVPTPPEITTDDGDNLSATGADSYRLSMACGQSSARVNISVSSPTAVITIDGVAYGNAAAAVLAMSNSGTRTVAVAIVDGSLTKTYTIELVRPFENVLVQRWTDVLAVVNNPANNGGYIFTHYQWYKNGVAILGATEGYIRETGGLSASSVYSALLTTADGIQAPSCSVTSEAGSKALLLRVYPNPAKGGQPIQVELSLPDGTAQAVLTLYDMSGKPIRKVNASQGSNSIAATLSAGIYVLKLTVENSEWANEKIVISE